MSRDVHLVGSVPMASASEVFEKTSQVLGQRLKRIPDGETGERGDWITWLEPVFADNPAFEKSGRAFQVHESAVKRTRYKLKDGVKPQDVHFPHLHYAANAAESYKEFKRLKDAGAIPAGTRFQVDLVPAHSVIWLFVEDDLHEAIDPIYNEAVLREIDLVCAAIPHDELAIQFDVASAVFARLERGDVSAYGATKAETLATFGGILCRLADRVPDDVELLFHFCYGDSNHRHVVEPTDMGDMVDMANFLTKGIKRTIDQIHMPVPRNRDDAAYFEPLKRLALKPGTRIALGLVHYTDGVEGTKRRLETAKHYLQDFAIGTECGFGRRDPATIPELLRIHAAAADLP